MAEVTTTPSGRRNKVNVFVQGIYVGCMMTDADNRPISCVGQLHPRARDALEQRFPGHPICEPSVLLNEDGSRIIPHWMRGSPTPRPTVDDNDDDTPIYEGADDDE